MKIFPNIAILEALDYAEKARLSPTALRQALGLKNVVHIFDDKDTDTQGYLFRDPANRTLIIGWRGSQQFKDWLNDFNAFHMDYPYGNKDTNIRVHRGIMGCWLSVRDKVLELVGNYLVDSKKPIDEVEVVGHSLGGAITTLCTVDLQYNFTNVFNENKYLLGFASGNPAVFNKEGQVSFDKRVPNFFRTYMRTDWVPNCPPKWFGKRLQGGYYQCGIDNPIGPRDPFCGLKTWFKLLRGKRNDLAGNLTNHNIDLYRKWLMK